MSSKKGNVAVSVEGIGKSYTISHNDARTSSAAEAIMQKIRSPFKTAQSETFWALKNVNFEVERGDVVGIIGRNGAGKSTLLKVLSRITEPTEGKAILNGRVGSLLEVGTGFSGELSGRENIYLNGAILGMTHKEIQNQFDAIIDFSGVERFLDTPVKRYSSGMYVRLAFAVAAHLNPEILIVDEVLAVGDAEFQRKCMGKMGEVAKSGRTVLFVSHNMQSVALLCNKGIFMRGGTVVYDGPVGGAINEYLQSFAQQSEADENPDRRPGSGEYRFMKAEPTRQVFGGSEPKRIRWQMERRKRDLGKMYVSAHVVDVQGIIVAQCDSRFVGLYLDDSPVIEGEFTISTPWLKPGDYRVDLFIVAGGLIDRFEGACTINVSPVLPYPNTGSDDGIAHANVFADYSWKVVSESGEHTADEMEAAAAIAA